MEIHHPSQGIAAIHDGSGPEDDLSTFNHRRVKGYNVLYVAFSVDGIVQSYAINIYQYPVCGKPSQHWAAAAELTLLYEDVAVE